MKVLLDTHTFLWYLLASPSLSTKSKQIIDTKQNLYFSIVSLWEIAIKINIGKLQLHRSIEDLSKELQYLNIQILPIIDKDIELYSTLTFPSNHRDRYKKGILPLNSFMENEKHVGALRVAQEILRPYFKLLNLFMGFLLLNE